MMLPEGLYERLLDEELEALVKAHPELTASFEKLDDEEQPHAFAQFVGQVLRESPPPCATRSRPPLCVAPRSPRLAQRHV